MILEKFNPSITRVEDGFAIEDAPNWTLYRNRVIHHYLQVFSSTLQRKYNYQVFLDLLSGSGLNKLRGSGEVILGPPMLALGNHPEFSKLIFCEKNPAYADALRVRVNKYYRKKNVVVFQGDPNTIMERLVNYIPESTSRNKVTTLCLIDLASFELEFETVRILSEIGVNFLVLLSLPWTQVDSYKSCVVEEREKLNAFIGHPWREVENRIPIEDDETFFRVLAKNFHQHIKSLGYLSSGSFYRIEDPELTVPYFFAAHYSATRDKNIHKTESAIEVATQVKLFE